jgi:hypothetical protein
VWGQWWNSLEAFEGAQLKIVKALYIEESNLNQ